MTKEPKKWFIAAIITIIIFIIVGLLIGYFELVSWIGHQNLPRFIPILMMALPAFGIVYAFVYFDMLKDSDMFNKEEDDDDDPRYH